MEGEAGDGSSPGSSPPPLPGRRLRQRPASSNPPREDADAPSVKLANLTCDKCKKKKTSCKCSRPPGPQARPPCHGDSEIHVPYVCAKQAVGCLASARHQPTDTALPSDLTSPAPTYTQAADRFHARAASACPCPAARTSSRRSAGQPQEQQGQRLPAAPAGSCPLPS